MSVNAPEITNGGSNPPEVIATEDFTELLFTSTSKGFEAEVTADSPTAIVASKPVKEADVTLSAKKGETVAIGIEGTRVKKSDFTVDGKGSMDMTVKTGTFQKNTVTGGKKADSISFGNQVTVKGSEMDLGKGNDTVTFGAETKFKGKTTLDLGSKGKDVVEFKAEPTSGKVVIDNFDKRDELIIGGETFTKEDLEDAKFSNIKINFAD